MRYWDTSALVPLISAEPSSARMTALLEADSSVATWWGTEIEMVSALARLEREGTATASETSRAVALIERFASSWRVIAPSTAVNRSARRLLRAHPLRAADALQLAAAVVACEGRPDTLPFVTRDERLADAAAREGFVVAGLEG